MDPIVALVGGFLLARTLGGEENKQAAPTYQPQKQPEPTPQGPNPNEWVDLARNIIDIGGAIARQVNTAGGGTNGYNPNANTYWA